MKCSCRLCGPQSWSIGSALRPLAGEAAVRPALSGRRGPRGCTFTSGNRVSSSACFLLFILYNSGQDTPKCKTSGLLSFHPSWDPDTLFVSSDARRDGSSGSWQENEGRGTRCSRCDLARGEACSPRGHAPAAPATAFTPKWCLGPRPDRAPACAISPSLSPTDGRGSRERRSLRSFLALAVLAPFTKGRNSRSLNVADPGKRACLRGALRGRRPRPARSFLSGNRRPCRRSTLLGTDRILRLKMTRFSKTARNELKRSRHVFPLSRFH